MFCNGNCSFCSAPCRKEIIIEKKKVTTDKAPAVFNDEKLPSVVENAGTFEVVKSVFGKEKVRKIK